MIRSRSAFIKLTLIHHTFQITPIDLTKPISINLYKIMQKLKNKRQKKTPLTQNAIRLKM